VGGWALEGWRQSLECDAVCDHVKSKPKYCPAVSTGAIVGIVIACVVVVGVVVGVLVYFFIIKPKKAAAAPDQQAGQQKPSDETPGKRLADFSLLWHTRDFGANHAQSAFSRDKSRGRTADLTRKMPLTVESLRKLLQLIERGIVRPVKVK
jgi:hypothetical protein